MSNTRYSRVGDRLSVKSNVTTSEGVSSCYIHLHDFWASCVSEIQTCFQRSSMLEAISREVEGVSGKLEFLITFIWLSHNSVIFPVTYTFLTAATQKK